MEIQPAEINKKMAWYLTLIALVPFVLIAGAMALIEPTNSAIDPLFSMFRMYSALLLTFWAGIRWGYIMREDNEFIETKSLVLSLLPLIFAWFALLAPQEFAPFTLLVFLLAYCALGAWDSFAGNSDKLPIWYSSLKIKATLAVAVCHISVFFVVGK